MTQCHCLIVKLSNSQLDKLKSTTKNEVGEFLRLSSRIMTVDVNDETNFPQQSLLTDKQVSKLRKVLQIIHEKLKLLK